jgi:hypothetical protein
LGPYDVSSGRRDLDGLTYRFALKKPVAIHTSTQGTQTAVDLVPDSFKGVPPDLPPPPPPAKPDLPDVSKLPVIKMRMGEYSDHTRLVFDWPAPVVYTVYPGQARISVAVRSDGKARLFGVADALSRLGEKCRMASRRNVHRCRVRDRSGIDVQGFPRRRESGPST